MIINEPKLHETRPEWRCGKCGKKYSFHEFTDLMNANYESGKMPICTCGYRFFFDKWKLQDILKVKMDDKEVEVLVSTVYLDINHGFFDKDLWYETMVFVMSLEKDVQDRCICRYETEEQAIAGHNKTLELVKSGNIDNDLLSNIRK